MTIRIYYLDDEADLCRGFERFMRRMGHEVATFVDPAAAIEACRVAPPDVLFVDYRLSDTTGDLVVREIDSGIKKVLVTGELGIKASDAFLHALSKPFRLKDADQLIRRLCNEPSE